jgi:hypothetical protein
MIKNNQKNNIIMSIIIAFIALGVGYKIADTLSKPIKRMEKMAYDLHHLNLHIPSVEGSKIKEIDEAIQSKILMKPGKLNEDERRIIETHSQVGARILKNPTSTIMEKAREIALFTMKNGMVLDILKKEEGKIFLYLLELLLLLMYLMHWFQKGVIKRHLV